MKGSDGMDIGMALASVAWADGDLDPRELVELTAALRSLGLFPEQIELVLAAARDDVRLEDVALAKRSLDAAREIVALGRCIARADGRFTEQEAAVLLALFERVRR